MLLEEIVGAVTIKVGIMSKTFGSTSPIFCSGPPPVRNLDCLSAVNIFLFNYFKLDQYFFNCCTSLCNIKRNLSKHIY